VGEELGFLGSSACCAASGAGLARAGALLRGPATVFGSYLAFGLSCLFGLQALVNMSVVMGLCRPRAFRCPSSATAGTALVMSLFMAGVLANISARNPEPPRPTSLWQALRFRAPKVKNRKAEAAPRIVVHVGGRPVSPAPAAVPEPPASEE
jgi:hypothetical protein